MSNPVSLGYSIHPYVGEGERMQCPVILVRGLGRSSGFWLQFLTEMRQFSDVICVDLHGTGKSANRWGRASVTSNSLDLLKTLRDLNVGPTHLVGISFGGMVALQAAAMGDFKSLTVMSSSAGATGLRRLHPLAALKLLAALRNSPPKNREFASYLVSEEMLNRDPGLPEKWDALWKSEGFYPIAVIRQLLAAAFFYGAKSLARINLPSHFLVSAQDRLVPWENSLEMWRRSAAFRLTVLQGFGHDFPTESPTVVASKIFEFCHGYES